MSTLITEAERRYLAAVLERPELAVDAIEARDLAHPGYAAVYQAVQELHREQPELRGADLTRAAAERADAPGLDAERLERLRADAPADSEIPFYVGMVLDGSAQRDLATYASTALASGETADPETPRLNARHAEQYRQLFDTPWPDQAVAAIAPETATRTGHEELLVAALMAYPEQARALVGIVPPEAVQDFRCRVAYEAVASAGWDGDFTTDISLVWQIAKAREIAIGLGDTPPGYTEPDAAFVARLARTETDQKTGVDTAKHLLTEDIKASLTAERQTPEMMDRSTSPASVFHHANQIDPHAPPEPQHRQGPTQRPAGGTR
ncbi:hypothetical protein [Glycomyces niveus]|uniref:DNA helicase DnaB-like N-terminal domain-containing protein n=1 Tax=Glycomyces niveus TaxID=2820287 RepID=A0ABS3U3C5_9ACTN|nr:hypothetical protein [Glycomyces sp. NEAU-S30]MBO3732751.1 hypothetical protein [Glycomyces sp. NEAU-S30]